MCIGSNKSVSEAGHKVLAIMRLQKT